ncbi:MULTISPECIES: tol-pal system protein YbgF [unclassified Gilliamella]|uniref:tol-pal system protein YbgF n=1 Tax=unclassified Gilliamella TaxID=2685620 RepID=UPI0013068C3D|nr:MULTISPECIES: tol-pal system protein YbgF [unclassified Gilliamella]MWP49634.1 tol-pal system protein YbgF [Gilliamella sp. Lep-s35]MWP68928.1 tol-pal system protein YbgF [Gilliamella sp. Lep-s5]MWP77573.1 tol-pal system protein YbgF [Gilliamella sp. Lep-s21]
MHKKILTLFLFLLFTGYGCSAGSSDVDRTIQAQGQLLIENQQKISDLQADVDTLRGQLEETKYQLNQVIERQKMIFQQIGSSSGFSPNSNSDSQESSFEPSSESTLSTSSPSDLSGWSTSGDDKADYNFIIQFVNDGKQNNETITAFQKYLKAYPKSSYQANVNYWIGQILYKQSKKDDASFYYATVVKNFPSSSKAADSLYKIGLILIDKGDSKKAKTVFQQVVNKYPKDKSVVDRAKKKLASLK